MTRTDPTPYRTLAASGDAELVVERSRFLAYAHPIASLDEAMAHVAELRREHYDARHVCYGLRLGRGAQGIDRSNDDGEPARTGGFPLWQLLDGEEVIDAALIVVRYFGGIKLGMGGLARAYRDAGRLALEDAGIVTRYPETTFALEVPYDQLAKLEHTLRGLDTVRVAETDYAAAVTLHLAVRSVALGEVRELLGGLLQRDPTTIGPSDPA
ncbi:MAG: YigZ family protein [Myxococcales bacterium]|nr:YigZ family protein [Myxococcales bacterium]